MTTQSAVHLVGEGWRRLSLSEVDVNKVVLQLRSQGCKVQEFKEGFACEVDGTQLFRATKLDTAGRYHVRLNSRAFPDV